MKRFLIALFVFLLFPIAAVGAVSEEEYNSNLSSYDLSFFEETLGSNTYDVLKELGIESFSFENIYSLNFNDISKVITVILKDKLKLPLEGVLSVSLFMVLSSFFQSLKGDNDGMGELYSTVSSLIIACILLLKISPAVTLAAASLDVAFNFVYAFIPVFCAIVAASGGITVSFSTNSMLLILSQCMSFLSSNIIMPLTNCFLALGISASLRPQLGLSKLIETVKKGIITAISFCFGAYVSVLSIKTAAAARVDMLGIRSLRFVISSAVPVVGAALSEGLVSIQTYSSLIKTSVGAVGIIAVALVYLPSLLEIVMWRFMLGLSAALCEMFENSAVSEVVRSFSSALLIINVILIVSALATVVSIGILIASGG